LDSITKNTKCDLNNKNLKGDLNKISKNRNNKSNCSIKNSSINKFSVKISNTINDINETNSNKNFLKVINSPISPQASSDEYQGISYKSSLISPTPVKTVHLCEEIKDKKISIDKDFRIKYKTEQCKFFEVNKDCKYGDNVKLFLNINLVCVCSWE
jgi:hypothetical protein